MRELFGERTLHADNPQADLHPRQQLFGLKRLHEVVVRAGVQSLDHVFLAIPGREQDEINCLADFAHAAANTGAIRTRHEPVEDRHWRRIGLPQFGEGTFTIAGDDDMVAGVIEAVGEQLPADAIVIGNQDTGAFHQCRDTWQIIRLY